MSLSNQVNAVFIFKDVIQDNILVPVVNGYDGWRF